MCQFVHIHNHTDYSLLDGASKIDKLVKKAKNDNMPALAITDHGNMFGVYEFVQTCNKEGIKPIIGCETYLVENRFIKSFSKQNKDKRYHQLLLAKNDIGYQNLSKLVSLSYKEGLYSKYPRIDFELLERFSEGLIATTCCIAGIVPQTILHQGIEAGEKELIKWQKIFGED
nr:PHP domain-containing protein [Chitinophagales bacterium]